MTKCSACGGENTDFVCYEATTWGKYRLDTQEYDIFQESEYKYYCPSCNEEIPLPIEEE